ncbi:DUF6517 family protein [Salinirubrum litoreum]|uniref:DUF6517 family protein n=1 Tax=Salinirubrum litoreum TaxID=1126234 RepID=A0ABD5RAB1_9EURY|nr:DUF6517 family protein [Salinirubrum litoreum]
MQFSRSRVSLAVALLVVLAGCTGTLAEFSSEPAVVPESALSGGYVHGNTTDVTVPLGFALGPVSRDVRLTGWVSGYSKTTDDDIALLAVVSTPDAEFEGQSLSPVVHLSDPELVSWTLDRLAETSVQGGIAPDVTGLRVLDTETRTVLGTPTEVVTYTGTAEVEGESVAVVLHLAVVSHEGDVIVALAAHDPDLDEREALLALMERIEHEGKE